MKFLMWKTLLISLLLSVCAVNANAEEEFKCGEYAVEGAVKKVGEKFVLKLYEGTMSEVTLDLADDLAEGSEIYLNKPVTIKGKMFAPVKEYRGRLESLLSEIEVKALRAPGRPYSDRFMRDDIKERVPDPLHPDLDSSIKLVKSTACPGAKK